MATGGPSTAQWLTVPFFSSGHKREGLDKEIESVLSDHTPWLGSSAGLSHPPHDASPAICNALFESLDTVLVVDGAVKRVREDVERLADLIELLLGLRRRRAVRDAPWVYWLGLAAARRRDCGGYGGKRAG